MGSLMGFQVRTFGVYFFTSLKITSMDFLRRKLSEYWSPDPYSFDPYSFDPYSFDPYSFDPYSFDPDIIIDDGETGEWWSLMITGGLSQVLIWSNDGDLEEELVEFLWNENWAGQEDLFLWLDLPPLILLIPLPPLILLCTLSREFVTIALFSPVSADVHGSRCPLNLNDWASPR